MAIKVYSPTDFEDTSSGVSIDGDFAVDTNTFFVDVSTDRVGIGTTSPGQKLDVNGTIRGSYLYLNDSTVPSLYMERGDGLPQAVIRLVKSNDNLLIGNVAIDEVIFYDDSGEAMRLDGSGNLGIGTTSPTTKLDVNGTVTISGPSAVKWKYSDNYAYFGIGYISGADYGFYNYNYGRADLYIQQSSGNLGIGTTSPAYKLDVAGDIRSSQRLWLSSIDAVSISGTDLRVGYSNDNLLLRAGSAERMRITSSGKVGIGTTSPTARLNIGANTVVQSTNGIALGVGQANLEFVHSDYQSGFGSKFYSVDSGSGVTSLRLAVRYNSTAWVDAMTVIAGTGNGNVGIGTTSPQKAFEAISGGNNFVSVGVQQLGVGQWAGVHFGYRESNASYRKSAIVFERTDLTSNNAQGKIHILNGPQNGSGSATLADAKLTIAENGNVGIGTTSPTYKLDVNGDARVNGNLHLDSVGDFITFYGNENSAHSISSRDINGTASDDLRINSYASVFVNLDSNSNNTDAAFVIGEHGGGTATITERFRVQDDGNIGIGTTSPSGKLDVRGGRLYLSPSGNSGSGTSSHALIAWNANDTSFTSAALQAYNSHTSWDISDKWAFAVSPRANAGSVHTHASESALESVVINRFVQLNSTNTAALNTWTFFQWDGAGTSALDLKQPSKLWSISTYENGATAEKLSFSGAGDMEIKRRLGIGQTPAAPLDVKSNSVSSADSGIRLISNATSNVIAAIGERATDGGRFHLYDAGVEKLAFFSDGTANHISAGNLLIGTTTDSGYKLDVAGTARFSDNVTISSSGAPKDLTIYGNSAGEFMQYDGSASALNIYGKSNSPALGVFVNGGASPTDIQFKVGRDVSQYYGIKVEDRTAFLVHRQDETDVGVHQVYNEIWTSGSGDHNWAWRIANNTGGSASEKMKLTKDSVLTLGGGSNTITDTKVGQWDTAYSWGDHSTQSYATQSYVNTQVSNLVDSAPSTLDTLNELAAALGDDPNFATTVTNSIAAKLPLTGGTLTGSLAGTNITATNFYGQNLYVTSSGNTVANRIDNDGSGLYFTYGGASNKGIYLKDSNGYVGIGTTIPANKLTVVGTGAIAALRSTAAVGQNYLDFVNSSGTPKGYVGYGASSSDTLYLTQLVSGADIAFYNSGVRMTVKSSGNVGIGTTSPSTKLEVSAETSAITIRTSYPSNSVQRGAFLWKDASNITGAIDTRYDGTTVDMHFGSLYNSGYNSTTRLVIKGNGNVGIGTTSPSAKLELNESSASSTPAVLITNDTGNQVKLGVVRSLAGTAPNTALLEYDSDLRFVAGAGTTNEVIRFKSSGNVGIGTTSPAAKLSVNGAILAGGKYSYRKGYGSLDTTGAAVAGLNSGSNGSSAMFKFEMHGGIGHYQKVVYSCYNSGGSWFATKVIDEGTNGLDVEASANNSTTITFTFKARNSTQYYSPAVTIEASGGVINTTYL